MSHCIIAFTKDWDDVPTCTTHVLREMGKSLPVLWVESIGTRRPSVLKPGKDLGRLVRRVDRLRRGAEWKENSLWVFSPFLIPKPASRRQVTLNRLLFALQQRRALRQMADSPRHSAIINGQSSIEYWLFVPNAVDLLPGKGTQVPVRPVTGVPVLGESELPISNKKLPMSKDRKSPHLDIGCSSPIGYPGGQRQDTSGRVAKVIYYCVDDWGKFENLDGTWLEEKERQLLQCADVVFTPSKALQEKCREILDIASNAQRTTDDRQQTTDNIYYVPHGVEYAKFARALGVDVQIPPDIAALPRPIIGFYGNLYPWIDFGLVERLARARPTWQFVMIGQAYCDVSGLAGMPNIHLPGRREHDELPAYCRGFDAAMIPYDMDHPRMSSVNPVKTRELLAAGVPVVASDIPELRDFGDDVLLCRTADEWLTAIEKQIVRTDRTEISARVRGEDWASKVAAMRAIVDGLPPNSLAVEWSC